MASGPEHYREAERRLLMAWEEDRAPQSVARLVAEAQVHATLALTAATALSEPSRSAPRATVPEWDAWHEAAGVKLAPAAESLTAAALGTVYRASHESIVMGLYATREAARAHCEAEERSHWPTGTAFTFAWIPDNGDPDSPEELSVFVGQNEESTTGYVVTPLEVASAYDPEAEA